MVVLEPLYAEPLFTEISYGSPASEDYMIIEPLFSNFPSVAHIHNPNINKGTFSLMDIESRGTRYFSNDFGNSNMNMLISSSITDDVTVLPEYITSYSQFLRFVSARTARLASIRHNARLRTSSSDEHSSNLCSVWYDDIYNFSKWKKFTEGRPKTLVFFRGRTFTYEKLPPFPNGKQGPKTKVKKRKKTVTSSKSNQVSNVEPSVLPVSNLNPLAIPFNFHFVNSNDCGTVLNKLRVQNVGNIIIGHLNINSIRNKFHSLVQLVSGNIDILVIGETKIDATFSEKQFMINGFKKPYRNDRNDKGVVLCSM